MNRKRRVIFYINADSQYSSEFNENIKIKMLKAYLRDVSHLDSFSLVSSSNTVLTDDKSIKDICGGNREVFFRVVKTESKGGNESHVEELVCENNELRRTCEELTNKLEESKMEQGNLDIM
jgi:hypothetical protein